jgi:hypothetical protein
MAPSGYSVRDTLVLLTISVGVLLIVLFIASNQAVYAVLVSVGLIIPFGLLALEYRKISENSSEELQSLVQRFLFEATIYSKVSKITPCHNAVVAYDLKSPNCNKKDWLTPSG